MTMSPTGQVRMNLFGTSPSRRVTKTRDERRKSLEKLRKRRARRKSLEQPFLGEEEDEDVITGEKIVMTPSPSPPARRTRSKTVQ